MPSRDPDIAVVVPSHNRPLRLRWLLNALAEQTLPTDRFEVIVGHDSTGEETEELLRTHPLARAGVLRHVALEPGTAPPGRNRNAAWRLARAPVIAFTDDDCRPPPQWLELALDAAVRHPGAIIQGTTVPDPEEWRIARHAPHYHSQHIIPPQPWAQACNIVYPKHVLETAGGFPEDMYVGEDTALAERSRASGSRYVADPAVITHHAVEESSLRREIARASHWDGIPLLLKRHPRLYREFPLWLFWKRSHVWLPVFILGWLNLPRTRLATLLMAPYMMHRLPAHGTDPRGRLRALLELPGRMAIDTAEMVAMVRGSLRHRRPFL